MQVRFLNLQLEPLLIMMFMHIAVLCQDTTHVSSFYSSQHLCEVIVIIPAIDEGIHTGKEEPRSKPRPSSSHWVSHSDEARSQIPVHSSKGTGMSLKVAFWPVSSWYLTEQKLSARQGRHPGNLVPRSSILLRVFSFPIECA